MASVCVPVSVDALGGMVVPGIPETDGPSVFWEFRVGVGVAENWTVFVSLPFWKISNFHPTSIPPEFVEDEQYPEFNWKYDWFTEYSDSRIGYQFGVGRCLGPFSVEAAAGVVKRTSQYTMSGVDVDGYGENEYHENRFLGSLGIVIPTGRNGVFNLGVKTEDFNHWFFSAGAGLTISLDDFTGTGGE